MEDRSEAQAKVARRREEAGRGVSDVQPPVLEVRQRLPNRDRMSWSLYDDGPDRSFEREEFASAASQDRAPPTALTSGSPFPVGERRRGQINRGLSEGRSTSSA